MRIDIKTKSPVKDRDIKALYLLEEAMKLSSSDRMKQVNLNFIKSKHKLL